MLISVIIVTSNCENYVEQALHSCITHDNSIEVILVDNASSDRTVELARRLENKLKNLNIIVNSKNIGPGLARNVGLAEATGEYITFLDGDDFYTDGALERLKDVINYCCSEVIVFNHQRMYDDGRYIENGAKSVLWERDASHFTERAQLMQNFGVAWNKLYRRDFLSRFNLQFRSGIYEDISWSFFTQILPSTLFVTHDIIVNYRQRRGSITKSSDYDHFNVFSEYDRVFELLKQRPTLGKAYGKSVYTYARRQIFHIVSEPHRVKAKRRYVRLAVTSLLKYRAIVGMNDFDMTYYLCKYGSFTGLKFSRTAWKGYKVTRMAANYVLRSSMTFIESVARITLWNVLRLCCPIKKNKVFVESYWGLKADCNPLAIAEALRVKGTFDIVWSFASASRVPKAFSYRWVRRGSIQMMREAIDCRYFISNVNIHDHIGKRPNTTHVQTWHGTPLKLMGLDIKSKNSTELNWKKFAKRSRRVDFTLSSNPYSSYIWRRSSPYGSTILEVGYPRNDVLFRRDVKVDDLKRRFGVSAEKKIALYAPTIRDIDKISGKPVSPRVFNPQHIVDALGDHYVLMMRAHYFAVVAPSGTSGRVLNVSDYPVTNDILLITDILITDYSSIMFDFCNLERPIIIYDYDNAEYSERRGVYFDIRHNPPGVVVGTQAELLRCLRNGDFRSDESVQRLSSFRNEFAPWDDGSATDRAISQIFEI